MREFITTMNASRLAQIAEVRSGWITQIAWSPDGAALAVASATGVRLFVNQFGDKPTHIIEGHTGHVKGMAFGLGYSPTGWNYPLIATCSADKTVKLWDAASLDADIRELATFSGHTDAVNAVVFSPKDSYRPLLVSGGADGTIQVWDVETRERRAVRPGHEQEVTSVAFALGGNLIVSGSWDHTVRLWDVESETGGAVLGTHDDWVRDVASNLTGTVLASASKDTTVRVWDTQSSEMLARILAHPGGADSVAFSPNGSLLATGGRDNRVRVWDVQRVIQRRQVTADDALVALQAHERPVLSVAFNPAGTLLASASGDNTVRLWSVGVGEDENRTDVGKTAPLRGN